MMKNLKRFLVMLTIQILIFGFMLECTSRLFWKIKYKVPLLHSEQIIYALYPELKSVVKSPAGHTTFNILLLGGSVLTPAWGSVKTILLEKSTFETKKPIEIFNLAGVGHRSLDSYIKYRYVKENTSIRFDLVVLYQGINDVSANNVPHDLFRNDYSHFSFYCIVSKFLLHRDRIKYLSFPFTLYYAGIESIKALGGFKAEPKRPSNDEWLGYGDDIKTAESFKINLQKIIDIASAHNEPVLLMTFAFYVPPDYTRENFTKKALDYTLHLCPIELWGTPENTVKTINVHNKVIREIYEQNKGLVFIDQAGLIPQSGLYFNDICHLTYLGSEKFVDNMMGPVKELASRFGSSFRGTAAENVPTFTTDASRQP
ncbi:MAG: hypothetical protein ACLQVJ_10930 [Syntrophobacteraceae bacterium]